MQSNPLMYQMYQMYADMTAPARALARWSTPLFAPDSSLCPRDTALKRVMNAACQVTALAGLTHTRPPFGIDRIVTTDRREYTVVEESVSSTPFCTLLRFRKTPHEEQPRMLVVAPVSGHFSTLLRNTVRTLLQDHDVYLTDWHNIRDVPREAGKFDLDDFVTHVIRFQGELGPGTHMMAICQPAVPALVAAAVMAEDHHPAQPATLTLMAGPIDTRINPTEVNKLATENPLSWFERNVIGTVPLRFPGALRKVYPGFLQISAFMSMNLGRHAHSLIHLAGHLIAGEEEKASATREFYEEYFAMMDLPAEFYLQTVQNVFQEHHLPRGVMQYQDRTVKPEKIRHTALLTVEGERDDICSIGQTMAAQEICSGIPPFMRKHHVQTNVGHYGVFSGSRWETEVYPLVRDFVFAFGR